MDLAVLALWSAGVAAPAAAGGWWEVGTGAGRCPVPLHVVGVGRRMLPWHPERLLEDARAMVWFASSVFSIALHARDVALPSGQP